MKSKRKDSLIKATGEAKFTDDLDIGEFLFGSRIGVPVTKGILKKIIFDPKYDWSEFTICTFVDLLSEDILPPKSSDEPILLETEVDYFGQPAVLLAHKNQINLKQALRHISFDFTEQTPTIGADIAHLKNKIYSSKTLEQGNVMVGMEESDYISEGIYTTQAQEHLYLETQIIVADFDTDNRILNIEGSMQAPFNVREALFRSFKKRALDVIVTPHISGGAFGGREDFTTQIALQASLLAIKSGKKIKFKLDRLDDLKYSTKRHPSSTKVKIGIKDNKINALEVDFLLDGGAFETISPIVLDRSMLHPGSFFSPNIKVTGKAVHTNTPPNGAFRGFGAPQTFFAVESHIDHYIKKNKLDEIGFRKMNLLTAKSLSLSGQEIGIPGVNIVFNELIKISQYEELKKQISEFNNKNIYKKRGLGIASVFHGTGYTGYQDIDTPISINLKLLPNGKLEIESSVIEFGQGSHTLLPQIASEILNIPIENISVVNINTKLTPSSGATVASRTATILGKLVERSARKLIGKTNTKEVISIAESYHRGDSFDYEKMQGHAYENFASSATLSLIEIDLLTYIVKVNKVFIAIDAGRLVNLSNAEGQVQGGILQGIGFALTEEMKMGERGYQNESLSQYIFPTSMEAPEIIIKFVDDGKTEPKGLGEIPISGVAPSIANALEDAIGIRLHNLPLTPEKIEKALR